MHWRAICPVWHLEQMRFGHAFVLRECPDATHTVHTLGNPLILSHVQQSHSKRRPCFEFNFPFLSFLTAAAVTDPADNLPAIFRDPADGLSAAFLRPRCWAPDGRTRAGQSIGKSGILCFVLLSGPEGPEPALGSLGAAVFRSSHRQYILSKAKKIGRRFLCPCIKTKHKIPELPIVTPSTALLAPRPSIRSPAAGSQKGR